MMDADILASGHSISDRAFEEFSIRMLLAWRANLYAQRLRATAEDHIDFERRLDAVREAMEAA